MNDTELQGLLDYCQGHKRTSLKPYYWNKMFRRFIVTHKERHITNEYPPPIYALGSFTYAEDGEIRLRFLTHIYWMCKHNAFEKVKRYIVNSDNEDWYMSIADDLTLDEVKEEYEKWDKYNE